MKELEQAQPQSAPRTQATTQTGAGQHPLGHLAQAGNAAMQAAAQRRTADTGGGGGHPGAPTAADLNEFATGVQGSQYNLGGTHWGDCSGAVASLVQYSFGKYPWVRLFSTSDQGAVLSRMGLRSGTGPPGSLNIGWSTKAELGRSYGHTAATLPNGVNFEMTPPHGLYGGKARGATDRSFRHQAHLPASHYKGGGSGPTPETGPEQSDDQATSNPVIGPVGTYKIKAGDTLWAIAARFLGDGRRFGELARLNRIANPNRIYPGTVLRIPGRTESNAGSATATYRVRPGDTLSAIAGRFLGSPGRFGELARLNGIANPNLIFPGQVIRLPGGQQQSTTQTTEQQSNANETPAKSSGGELVTVDQLVRAMPDLSEGKAAGVVSYLNQALVEGDITTPKRIAAFIAQVGHESGSLLYFEERDSGARYEGRRDLGNTEPGDGVRFKGRGPIQLTGRYNYTEAGKALGLDLVNDPEQVATYPVGFRTTVWYWTTRHLNGYADSGDFQELTRRINGGYNGLTDRMARWALAKQVFGA